MREVMGMTEMRKQTLMKIMVLHTCLSQDKIGFKLCLKCQCLPCIVAHVVFEAAEDNDDGDEDDQRRYDAPSGRCPPHQKMLVRFYKRRIFK